MSISNNLRFCKSCNTEKELNGINFINDRYAKGGLSVTCRACCQQRSRDRYQLNKHDIEAKRNKDWHKQYYRSERGVEVSRKTQLKCKFGITLEYYNKMLEFQNGVCGICGEKDISTKNKVLSVDHNHNTGKIRGLLCSKCNRGIGNFSECYRTMVNAIVYLNRFNHADTNM